VVWDKIDNFYIIKLKASDNLRKDTGIASYATCDFLKCIGTCDSCV
jgi:hypothetical protein